MRTVMFAALLCAAGLAAPAARAQLEDGDCPRGAVWTQELAAASALVIWWSDVEAGMHILEKIDGYEGTVTEVHWWGVETTQNDRACERDTTDFDIIFYSSNSEGLPDDVLEGPISIEAERAATGITADGYDVFSYTAELPETVSLDNDWISIIAVDSDDCYFNWASSNQGDDLALYHSLINDSLQSDDTNYAFCITGEEAGEGEGEGEGEVITIQCPGGSIDLPASEEEKHLAGDFAPLLLAAALMLAARRFMA